MTQDAHRNPHENTASLKVYDSRGLSIRQVEYVRNVDTSLEALITRLDYDFAGRLVSLRDPRLVDAPKPNLTHVYGLSSRSLMVDRVDAGRRINLPGVAGEVVQHWDERGNRWRNTYDEKLRLLTVVENAQDEIEALTYWQGDADPDKNQCGQLHKKVDPSSAVEFKSFSLHGLPFEETLTLLSAHVYTTKWTYGADGKPLSQTDARGHQQHSRYDIAGQLTQVTLKIDADSPVLQILEDAQYNADGQLIKQLTGNKVVRTWGYDSANGRLTNTVAGVEGQPELQNLEYFYDPVGNVVRIDNHAFKPVYFKNQVIDGSRSFTYSSLYQLLTATGHDAAPTVDIPGLPLPSDPGDHLNYKQCFEYDKGNNLIKLTHSRAIGGYTHHMYIDPSSNRGVRWTPGDSPPDIESLFDRHGNLQQLQPGQPLTWNNRDEPSSITLIKRDADADDKEIYRYSDGKRLYKRHETHTPSTTHFHEVHYLNGLEIRTRETGEELHVITLPAILGNVRCLHWVSLKPDGIDNNQVRYILDENLGSSLTELDQDARIISHEEYYPYGGTAFLTKGTAPGIGYKTIRYSGKEMDNSGLYYYGRRYYAPWLQCWISPDPAGEVDGPNLYAMVGNNPMTFFDRLGLTGGLAERVSQRTTEMIMAGKSPPTGSPAKQAKALKLNPDSRYTKTFRKEVAVAHSGASISTENETTHLTDFINIPTEKSVVLTSTKHGIHQVRPTDNSLGDDLSAYGVYEVTDPGRLKEYMKSRYIERLADKDLAVKVYSGSQPEYKSLSGMQYEVPAMHEQIEQRMLLHIEASGRHLPVGRGLPAAHAEVQAASAALHIQHALTGSTDPETIELATQVLTGAEYAVAFPACFSCTGHLIATYDNTVKPFSILTGIKDGNHSEWRAQIDQLPPL
jgi:insecticidal toxin complex protein TccC